ncbi:MAG: endolytic transglycosylase MltG [Ruminococcus sp.]|nr:endolytic transglycosylase MltG [Ruminococcus sp.]
MSEDSRNNIDSNSIEETRRKKMEEFKQSFDQNAIRGEYEDDAAGTTQMYSDESSVTSYSTDSSSLKRRKGHDEINSFSDSDTRKRIERDSKKELKQQKKEEKKIEKLKAKRNRRIFKLVWLSMIIIVGVMVAQYILVGVNDLLGISRTNNPHTVTVSIPANPTLDDIANALKEKGVIERTSFFKMYANFTSNVEGFRQGDFQIDTNKDYEAIINYLQSNVNRTDIVTVQITEGMSVLEIADTLHENGVISDIQAFLDTCNSNEFDEDYPFLKAITNAGDRYYKLEGYLFPDTYDFYLSEKPAAVIEKFLYNFENKITLHKEKYFGSKDKVTLEQAAAGTGYTTDQILTIASIIQAEAANKEDMYYISSILHNRLDYGAASGVAKLNCDCTVYYPYRKAENVPESIRTTFVSRYNTNNFDGLPAGPVCNPGAEAIKAAIKPYESDYLFFCHDTVENGATPMYAETLEGHEENLSMIGKAQSTEEIGWGW